MKDVLIGGYYNHYKNKPYKVLDVATHSEELREYVVYEALYQNETSQLWVRPKEMFLEKVNGISRFELVLPPVEFKAFHSHIYFDENKIVKAENFHKKFSQLSLPIQISKLIHKPIGPHPFPMFEVDFKGEHFLAMIHFMQENRDGLSILIHPLSGNEILDHTDHAMFLGKKEKLNLAIFNERLL